MNNFTFYSPTKVIFGTHTAGQVATELRGFGGHKILVLYGGGSAKKSGLLDTVEQALTAEGLTYYLRGGVQPNPLSEFAQQLVTEFRPVGIDFVLAVGGGSVIDTAKAVAIALAGEDTPVWDYFCGKGSVTAALPVGVILTIAAAGSETSDSAVLTNGETHLKRGVNSDWNRPKFAIMDPTLTYSLPARQTACGVTDIMMHTMDRYFAPNTDNALSDGIAQTLLRTTIRYGTIVMAHPADYKARSELMWCGSVSHNDLTGLGQPKDFSVHALGHELSAMFDMPHGESLSVMWPAWARYVCSADMGRFAQFARTVWDIAVPEDEKAALLGIEATERYFRSLGMPVTLEDAVGVQDDRVLHELAYRCTFGHQRTVGAFVPLGEAELYEIYLRANHSGKRDGT
ncbi:MAG: iron-containing alcohol dehydrogenase [Oscillospiraceae bacterium]